MFLPAATLPRTIPDASVAAALFAPLAEGRSERAMVAYLADEARLLGLRLLPPGDGHEVVLPFRLIVAEALELGATGMVLAHNHPSGDARPSEADLAITRRLARTLSEVDVRLIDHLVLAGAETTSFRALGLL